MEEEQEILQEIISHIAFAISVSISLWITELKFLMTHFSRHQVDAWKLDDVLETAINVSRD